MIGIHLQHLLKLPLGLLQVGKHPSRDPQKVADLHPCIRRDTVWIGQKHLLDLLSGVEEPPLSRQNLRKHQTGFDSVRLDLDRLVEHIGRSPQHLLPQIDLSQPHAGIVVGGVEIQTATKCLDRLIVLALIHRFDPALIMRLDLLLVRS